MYHLACKRERPWFVVYHLTWIVILSNHFTEEKIVDGNSTLYNKKIKRKKRNKVLYQRDKETCERWFFVEECKTVCAGHLLKLEHWKQGEVRDGWRSF